MNIKTILMCAMALGGACALGDGTKEITLGTEDGLPCKLTLVEIPGSGNIAGFAIGKSEITQELYEKVMGENPSTDKGAQLPVNNVSRAEAMKFCDRLNELVNRPNLKWTLPTSNQWQRVAKAGEKFEMCGANGFRVAVVDTRDLVRQNVVAEKLQACDFLLNEDFKKDAKYYLCLFSASWCGPCRREMPRIAKTYAETLKDDPDIELIHFSRDQDDEKAMAWAKEHDVKFPVVKPKGGNPLDLRSRGIPHLFIVKADGTLVEEGHPASLFTEEKLRAIKSGPVAVPETATEKTRKAIAKLFPGWSLDTEVYNHDFAGIQASHRGQSNVVFIHPKDQNTPAILSRTVTLSNKNPCLFLKVSTWHDDADFLLSVRVDGKDVLTNRLICTPDAKPWEDIVVPLSACRGSTAKVEIVFTANGWWYEFPYLARVEIAEGSGDMRIAEGKATVDGYTWSYRAQNGEATIVAENDGRFSAVSPRPVGHITIPATLGGATVTHIGRDAFLDCSGMTSATIPESVVRIGRGAFHDCTGLRSLKIPSGVRIIERDAFLGCTALTAITIPEGVASIERDAFRWCCGLESVVIPSSVKHIGTDAFRYCRGLTEVTIPQSVTDIGWQAFRGCNALTSMTIPASVTNICNFAFCDMGAMTAFRVDEGNRFYKSENGLLLTKDGTTLVRGVNGDVTIPSSVTNIGTSAFEGSVALRSVAIPSGVKSIGDYSFKQCRGMTAVTIPESVTSIGREAFNKCSGLKSMMIPAAVTNIDRTAFDGCANLKSVDVVKDGKSAPMSMDEFWKSKGGQEGGRSNLLGGRGRSVRSLRERRTQRAQQQAEAAKAVAEEKARAAEEREKERAQREAERAVREKEREETQKKLAKISEELKRLREHVGETKGDKLPQAKNVVAEKLQTCDFLLNEDFKKDAKYYLCLFSASWCGPCRREMPRIAKTYAETLKDDPDIELIHFSRDQDDEKAMAWAKEHDVKFPVVKPKGGNPLDLRSRGIPHLFIVKADGTLVEEGHPASLFTDEKIDMLTGKTGKATVGDYTWSYCVKNGEATIVSLDKKEHCAVSPNPIGTLAIPSEIDGVCVTKIGRSAFRSCRGLTAVTIPDSVTDIGEAAFYGCNGLTSAVIPPKVANIGKWTFGHCGKLSSVTMPPGVTNIGDYAFYGCRGIVSVGMPSRLTSIGDNAFGECVKLAAISIPAGVMAIGEAVFAGCSELQEIKVAPDNQTYASADGVLYTKDMQDLVACPGGLTSVTVPSCVSNIRESAFRGCGKLRQIAVEAGNRKYSSADGVLYTKDGEFLLACPGGLTSVTIRSGVSRIGDHAFYLCDRLASVTIPQGVTEIGRNAFNRCRELRSVTIPPGVRRIGRESFSCSGLTSATIPSSVNRIEDWTFWCCTGLESVEMAEGVTSIGYMAFYQCRALTTVVIPASVKNIAARAFEDCSGLTSITMCGELPDSRDGIFSKCGNLKSIHVPANAKSWAGMKEWQGIPLVFDAKAK